MSSFLICSDLYARLAEVLLESLCSLYSTQVLCFSLKDWHKLFWSNKHLCKKESRKLLLRVKWQTYKSFYWHVCYCCSVCYFFKRKGKIKFPHIFSWSHELMSKCKTKVLTATKQASCLQLREVDVLYDTFIRTITKTDRHGFGFLKHFYSETEMNEPLKENHWAE